MSYFFTNQLEIVELLVLVPGGNADGCKGSSVISLGFQNTTCGSNIMWVEFEDLTTGKGMGLLLLRSFI